MSFFSEIALKIVPLYANVLLGFLAGKFLDIPRDAIARILFYMIAPLIMFNGTLYVRIDPYVLSLPFLVFIIGCSLCLFFYWWAGHIWKDSLSNLVGFAAGTCNGGYFGLPIALLIFDEQGEGIYMITLLGVSLYESTLGFYICTKGQHTPKECVRKLLRLPILYAFLIALFINYIKAPIPLIFNEFMVHIKGTYTFLGMMIIGLGISGLKRLNLDLKFVGITFLAKFLAWPAIIFGIIILDVTLLGIYSSDIHQALILLALVPLAVNTVVLASLIHAHSEKAATAVLLSTLFALIYIPAVIIYFNSTGLCDPIVCISER